MFERLKHSLREKSRRRQGQRQSRHNRRKQRDEDPEQVINERRITVASVERTALQPRMGSNQRDEILRAIPEEFFTTEYDPIQHILSQLPEVTDDDFFEETEAVFHKQLGVVSQELSEKVSRNYGRFVDGMTHIHEIGKELQMTSILCTNGRHNLSELDGHLVSGGLRVISKKQRREAMLNLRKTLLKLRDLQETEKKIRRVIEEGEFPEAIALTTSYSAATTGYYSQFHCLRGVDQNAKEHYAFIRKMLENSLRDCTRSFDPSVFEMTIVGYKMLGSGDLLYDSITSLFRETVENVARSILLKFSGRAKGFRGESTSIQEMCRKLDESNVVPCIMHVLEGLTNVMCNLNAMLRYLWDGELTKTEEQLNKEKSFGDIRKGLEKYRKQMWDSIQRTMSQLLSSLPCSHLKPDQFLELYHLVCIFTEMGKAFSGGEAESIVRALLDRSRQYFDAMHKETMDVISMMLENESWQNLATTGFSLENLREFKGISDSDDLFSATGRRKQLGQLALAFLEGDSTAENPFTKLIRQEKSRDQTQNGEEDSDDNEQVDMQMHFLSQVDEYEGDADEDTKFVSKIRRDGSPPQAEVDVDMKESEFPVVFTSASLNVVRSFGKYLKMMEILEPISFDIFRGIGYLFQFYFYVVFSFFGNPYPSTVPYLPDMDQGLSAQLWSFFSQIKDFLTQSNPNAAASSGDGGMAQHIKLSYGIDIDSPNELFGLVRRSVAAESLVTLLDVLKALELRIRPKVDEAYIQQFISALESGVNEGRAMIYVRLAERLFPLESVAQSISNYKWDLHEISEQHNRYINEIHEEFVLVHKRIESSQINTVSKDARGVLVNFVLRGLAVGLVEGYSRVKKCTNEGRAQMSLDFKTLQNALETLTGTRPLPFADLVDTFIKAYYLRPEDIVQFAVNHPEYSSSQIVGLINSGFGQQMKRKARTELINRVEQLEKDRLKR